MRWPKLFTTETKQIIDKDSQLPKEDDMAPIEMTNTQFAELMDRFHIQQTLFAEYAGVAKGSVWRWRTVGSKTGNVPPIAARTLLTFIREHRGKEIDVRQMFRVRPEKGKKQAF